MEATRSILIVEDEPLIAMMLEDFLDSLGHKISGTCDTVDCALAEVEKGGFDLAILDVNLKGENVWPVATRLREKKVIASTSPYRVTYPRLSFGIANSERDVETALAAVRSLRS